MDLSQNLDLKLFESSAPAGLYLDLIIDFPQGAYSICVDFHIQKPKEMRL